MTVGSQKKPPLGLSAPSDRLEDTAMRTVLEQTGAAGSVCQERCTRPAAKAGDRHCGSGSGAATVQEAKKRLAELPDIAEQRLIVGLLKYCGYSDYADRVSRHSGQRTETTLYAGREDGFEVGCDVTIGSDVGAAALPNSGTTAAVTPFVKGIEVKEAADVT
jgi:hypothetical protein